MKPDIKSDIKSDVKSDIKSEIKPDIHRKIVLFSCVLRVLTKLVYFHRISHLTLNWAHLLSLFLKM